jgi:hypothetical protein
MYYNSRQSTQEAVIRMKIWMQGALVVVVAAAICGTTAQAQTDVALSGFATFTSSTSGFGTVQTPHNSVGGLLEVRHIVNPLVGFEFSYSFNPANQSYAPKAGACGFVCGDPPLTVTGDASEVGGNWVFSVKKGSLRPFVLGGAGFMITLPTGNSPYTINTVVRPVFVYGGGLDWSFLPHLGLRLQVRGNTSKAPNLSNLYTSTTQYTQIYEPMGGVFYRF